MEGRIDLQSAIESLSKITGYRVDDSRNIRRYLNLRDSLGSLSAIHQWVYQQTVPYSMAFFANPVDYYARVMTDERTPTAIKRHALADLAELSHPRSLYYMAAAIYRFRNDPPDRVLEADHLMQLLEQRTHTKFRFVGVDTAWTLSRRKHLLHYWTYHYTDYTWDEQRMAFVNQTVAVQKTELYEQYFRRLNSRNDSVSFAAYRNLSVGDPYEVLSLKRKYDELISTPNPILPDLSTDYLDQAVWLTNHARQWGQSYQLPDSLLRLVLRLSHPLPPPERYATENRLIDLAASELTTALEYEGILRVGHQDLQFSLARVLQRIYYRDRARFDDVHFLRWYLKKAALFSRYGRSGQQTQYLSLVSALKPYSMMNLRRLLRDETDQDVRAMFNTLWIDVQSDGLLQLDYFIQDPFAFGTEQLTALPKPGPNDLARLHQMIQSSEDARLRTQYLKYWRLHPSTDGTPYLIDLLGRELSTPEVLELLSAIYGVQREATDWLVLWQSSTGNYQSWTEQLLREQMTTMETDSVLTIRKINDFLNQRGFRDSLHLDWVLNQLRKVQPPSSIRFVRLRDRLNVEDHLKIFSSLELTYRQLDDVPKLFALDHPEAVERMLTFVDQRARNYTNDNAAILYNRLLRTEWMQTYLRTLEVPNDFVRRMQTILRQYYDESPTISEFAEQTTLYHLTLLQMVGQSLSDRLLYATQLEVDELAKAKIQRNILSTLRYDQIPIALRYYEAFSSLLAYNFLYEDFGLPVFGLERAEVRRNFLQRYQSSPQPLLYERYLEDLGLSIRKSDGRLDLDQIQRILRYDLVEPFCGDGGRRRYQYVYGVIKILEFEYGTTLGFHEKLNENQTFYQYNPAKRATAWLAYLQTNTADN